jgi:hypothetical protein
MRGDRSFVYRLSLNRCSPFPGVLLSPPPHIVHAGITCFINRQLIYNFPEQIFTEAGVISIEHADFDGALLCRV